MAKSGVSYYVENFASFDYENEWKVWFDAKSPNQVVTNRGATNQLYSGFMAVVGLPPSALLSVTDCITVPINRYGGISILPNTGLWSDDFSLIFLNKKKTVGKTLIFDCMSTGTFNNETVYRGYRIGYTDSNKPFFEYYGKNGFESFVGDYNLPTDHSLNFVKAGNSLTIGHYDFLTQSNNNQSFNIDSDYLFEPTGGVYSLGYTPKSYLPIFPTTIPTLSGVVSIDEFLYFTHALYDYDIQIINSGFVADYVAPVTGSGILYSTGITGYSTGLVPLLTGITGYGITGTGLFTDDFGVEFTGYQTGALYANLSGTGVLPLTGVIQTVDYYLGNGSLVLDSGYMRTFYNSGQCFLRKVDEQDIIECFNETGKIDWIETEQYGKYDIAKSKFKVFESNPTILSLNGQIQKSGPLMNTGTIYHPSYIISGDYYNTGYYIESLSGFNKSDTLFSFGIPLSVTSNYENFSYSGGVPYTGSGLINDRSLVFFNGIKLNNGQYSRNNTNLIFSTPLYGGETGRLLVVNLSGSFTGTSGKYYNNTGVRNPYYSHVFLNGQLLNRDTDYLSISRFSLLNNSGIFSPSESTNLYNDLNSSDLFWSN